MKTKSEDVFESFLTGNNIPFEKIEEEASPRPDYLVHAGGTKIVFEVKELAQDDNFGVVKDSSTPSSRATPAQSVTTSGAELTARRSKYSTGPNKAFLQFS